MRGTPQWGRQTPWVPSTLVSGKHCAPKTYPADPKLLAQAAPTHAGWIGWLRRGTFPSEVSGVGMKPTHLAALLPL